MNQFSEYIRDPLDEYYLVVPDEEFLPRTVLPTEEWEVRKAVAAMKILTDEAHSQGLMRRLFKPSEYRAAIQRATSCQQKLMDLVNSTPQHKAAMRRIVNSMPQEKGGRQALADYIR